MIEALTFILLYLRQLRSRLVIKLDPGKQKIRSKVTEKIAHLPPKTLAHGYNYKEIYDYLLLRQKFKHKLFFM